VLELWGADSFLDAADFGRLVVRMGFDLLVVLAIVRGIYLRRYRQQEFVLTYFLFNLITFSLCHILRQVPIELGFALGLFAVFGILRYRTEAIRIRDLTYLFIVIGIGILNAVANEKISVAELLLVNGAIVGATGALEAGVFGGGEEARFIVYDRVDLLHPDRQGELLADLRGRLGVDVHRVAVGQVDLLRDTVQLTAYYRPPRGGGGTVVGGGAAPS
jgi:hypothetical protein